MKTAIKAMWFVVLALIALLGWQLFDLEEILLAVYRAQGPLPSNSRATQGLAQEVR